MVPAVDSKPKLKYVQTLVGKRSLDVALQCIARLPTFSQEPIALVVHNDGTLEVDDIARLTLQAPIERVISAEEAEAVVNDKLRTYPQCRRYRDFRFTGRIVFDAPLFAEDEMFYFDADVLFNKSFVIEHFWQDRKHPFIFMQGEGNAYCLSPWQFVRLKRQATSFPLRLCNRINAGVICLSKSCYDLDFLEYLLSQPLYQQAAQKAPYWWNQTTYTLLAARHGCGVLDPRKVVNASVSGFAVERFMSFAAVHFTSPYRALLPDCVANMAAAVVTGEPVKIDVVPAEPYVQTNAMLRSLWRKVRVGQW